MFFAILLICAMFLDRVICNKCCLSRCYFRYGLKAFYPGREAKVGNFRKWLLTSLAQNRLIIYQQFCVREVKQPLAKFATS